MKLSAATECFYKAVHSITNFYNPRLYSNILQFPSLDDFESQFFGYPSLTSDLTLGEKLKEVKARQEF
jgi:hypothetical protein